ncbi:MAG: DUF3347 domain-containing protein [Acidobacteria bacterium]|nr:MAG: DUF3347 domain-containing protein [Acidobacteriota bacterium]
MKKSLFSWLLMFPFTAFFASAALAQHDHGAGGHAGHTMPMPETTPAVPDSQGAFEKILDQYYKIHDALANDTTEGVDKAAQKIAKIASEAQQESLTKNPDFGAIGQAASGLPGKNLAQARDQFFLLSKPIIAELQSNPSVRKSAFAYKCSMANKTWAQGKKEVRNPYYGKSMQKCGEPL